MPIVRRLVALFVDCQPVCLSFCWRLNSKLNLRCPSYGPISYEPARTVQSVDWLTRLKGALNCNDAIEMSR